MGKIKRSNRFRRHLSGLRRRPAALLSAIYLVLLAGVAIAAPLIAPYSPIGQDIYNTLLPPSLEHLLGTDDLGRDVLSRLIHGTGSTLSAGLIAISVASVLGVPLGLAAGYLGGWIDAVISRVLDAMLSFPGIIIAIGVTGALGAGLVNSMVAIGIIYSPILARLTRAQSAVVKHELYVDAARCFGAGPSTIMFRHILPNTAPLLIVQIALLFATALLAEASLSFLGLGVAPPQPSWGAMLARAYNYMDLAPEQMYAPGLAILVTAMAFNAVGEFIRRSTDRTGSGVDS